MFGTTARRYQTADQNIAYCPLVTRGHLFKCSHIYNVWRQRWNMYGTVNECQWGSTGLVSVQPTVAKPLIQRSSCRNLYYESTVWINTTEPHGRKQAEFSPGETFVSFWTRISPPLSSVVGTRISITVVIYNKQSDTDPQAFWTTLPHHSPRPPSVDSTERRRPRVLISTEEGWGLGPQHQLPGHDTSCSRHGNKRDWKSSVGQWTNTGMCLIAVWLKS